jgi:hypothetical protein
MTKGATRKSFMDTLSSSPFSTWFDVNAVEKEADTDEEKDGEPAIGFRKKGAEKSE